ncbi:agamous-like MADS-box protein AGL61 [Cajanus cajan]|uniref:Agamous-like MADS-box protein AGL62 n=1 Tax=Cajanus cajan TaxID=3821 RepID=A0A151U7E1_CAJCA|nr:agamous-like MADS-box protein AGL61 [Cajanus cajan]KYP75236.1 Agamous-like MADS-box protein AGL62 [Cajanus cajan]
MDMLNQKKKKINTGRKKIEIKKLDKASNKQVTFSKRRTGLFKKASELCILCNVYAAIIVFSPADKLFIFSHPDIDTILTRYVKGTAESEPTKSRGKTVSYEEHNMQYEEAKKKLEMEKKILEETEMLAKTCNGNLWWNQPVDQILDDQLEPFMVAVYELRKKLAERATQLMMFGMQ